MRKIAFINLEWSDLLCRILILTLSASAASCGTFQLANNIDLPAGKSAEQREGDILFCKDKANLAVNGAGRQTGDFFLGMTIIGAPIAYEMDKSKQREVFAQCMVGRGYSMTIPGGSRVQSAESTNLNVVAPLQTLPSTFSLILPTGWKQQPLTDAFKKEGVIIFAINRATDVAALLNAGSEHDISDFSIFVSSKMAAQASRISEAHLSEILKLQIRGKTAYRSTISGSFKGSGITFLITIIDEGTEYVYLNTWTSSANFASQRSEMEKLSEDITGL